jgi:hypothetical protein
MVGGQSVPEEGYLVATEVASQLENELDEPLVVVEPGSFLRTKAASG